MAQADYEIEDEKKFPWGWVIGGIFILLFGACSFAIVGVFKNIGVVKPINDDFIARVLDDRLPEVSSGMYSEKSGITEDAIAPLNQMIATLGTPDEIAETNCSANSNASTPELSGEFVSCSGAITYSVSSATLSTRWRKEDDQWKLLQFNLDITDVEAYANLVAEQKLSSREAAGN